MILVLSRSGSADTAAHEEAVLTAAVAAGARVWVTGHLYHLAEDCALWADLAAQPGPLRVAAWLHPRPCTALCARHGAWPEGSLAVDLGCGDAAAVVAALQLPGGAGGAIRRDEAAERPRWHPVLDPAACTSCGHCHQFCLFGVYARDADGRVRVVKPDACKAGCPACARVCPQGAVMFPLHRDGAIAGAPGQRMQLDLQGRALFYNRTGKPCPRCGLAAKRDPGDGEPCPECGRRRPRVRAKDGIDLLLDDLDRLGNRR